MFSLVSFYYSICEDWLNVIADSYGKELDKSREDCVQGAVTRRPGFILGDNTPYQVRFTFFWNNLFA